MEVILKNVRLSFPSIFEMSSIGDGEPAYSAKFIIEPDSENAKLLKAAVEAVAKDKWKEKAAGVLQTLKEDKKVAYVEGPYKNKNGEPYDGYEGMFNLSARSSDVKPTVKDRRNQTVAKGDAGAPYNGCYVHTAVDIWAQDNKWGRRINCKLLGVMFYKDGTPFSGGAAASDSTFADLAQEPSAEDFV
jgi:hypothetical protein